jgi:hypothetical protein
LEENLSSQKTFDCASTLISFEFRMEALARLRKHPDDDLPVSLAGWPATNRRIASSLTTRCPSLPPRELSFSRGDLPEALERQFHAAAPADLAGGFHWRIPRRADAPAGYDNHPMIVPVATSLPRYDIDSVDAVVILPRREAALRSARRWQRI